MPHIPVRPGDPASAVRRVREAMSELSGPADTRISPDGRLVAVTVSGPGGADVVVVPADPDRAAPPPRPGPAVRRSPRWLPDSRTLLLIAEPERPGPPSLTAWDTVGGSRAVLATVPGAVEDLLVADDGTEVLLLVADDGAERDGMHLGLPVRLGPDPAPESSRPGAGRRRLLHGRLAPPDLLTGPDAAPAGLRDAGPRGLTVWNAAWRGGRTAVATVSEETLPAGYYAARLARIDLANGSAVTLHRPAGQLAAPALSADRRHAAVVEGVSIVAGRPVLADLADGTVTAPTAAEDVTWLHPVPDGAADGPRRLLTAGPRGTGTRVAEVRADADAPGGARVDVAWEEQAVLTGAAFQPALSLSADGRTAATVREAPGVPPEAVVAPTGGPDAWSWRPVTAPEPAVARGEGGFGDLAGVRTREVTWTASDGRSVHGLLLDAPGVAAPGRGPGPGPARGAGGPRPLAVLLHGGPSWLWSAGYAPADVLGLGPALAAAGWLVLLPNPRGSSGYGLDHARAVVGGFGDGDLDDVLSGVGHLTAGGEALPGRAAVLGHSYGGWLAALASARTDVFRAAVVVSAPTDWLSFAHTSVIGGGYEYTYGIGDPDTAAGRSALIGRSPVFADGGTGTPTLILHGERDRVTPVGQAQELYRALARRAAAPVELHVYPGEGHEFTGAGHLLDAAVRTEEWLTRHVVGTPEVPGAPEAPGLLPVPGVPEVPGPLEVPGAPDRPDLPAPAAPAAASAASTASVDALAKDTP
ncbi:prolyl oligopeptidase family serine peptidase [Streptomyces sp. CRN 30]|uniref:prolyl oligopeptidase family serine peptidase n=1 Tax=Streptomyces sp. CRN 30 TaxID=3075613 RepID=UPI002A81DA50|nr:prolyl oligopeptidase family serine peptidase [Streptomyces sp. CRN 30]